MVSPIININYLYTYLTEGLIEKMQKHHWNLIEKK